MNDIVLENFIYELTILNKILCEDRLAKLINKYDKILNRRSEVKTVTFGLLSGNKKVDSVQEPRTKKEVSSRMDTKIPKSSRKGATGNSKVRVKVRSSKLG